MKTCTAEREVVTLNVAMPGVVMANVVMVSVVMPGTLMHSDPIRGTPIQCVGMPAGAIHGVAVW